MKGIIEDFDELVDYLLSLGHSAERAKQIAGNHPDAVRTEFDKSKGATDAKKEATASQDESAAETAKPDTPA